jgi:hypothetical protein
MTTEKLCPKCEEIKLASQFYKVATRTDGLSGYCRTCQLRDAKSRYSPHPRWRAPEGQKYCPKCDTTKDLEAFGNNRAQFDGKQNYCKPCCVATVTASRHKDPTSHRRSSKAWREANPERNKDNHAKWRYGLEHGSYAEMLAQQNGKCAICFTDKPGKNLERFAIDHCHKSNVVRGLLCENCNRAIGLLKEDTDIIESAIKYIKRTRLY